MSRTLYPILQAPVLAAGQYLETVTEDRWHQPWSEPVRFRILPALAVVLATASGQFFNPQVLPNVDPGKLPTWFAPFTDPVRVPARLTTGGQRADFLVEAAPFLETVTESRWHYPWSEPVRVPLRLGAGINQFQPDNPFGETQPETVTESRWHYPWSEPVRFRPPPLITADQKADWLVEAKPFTETVSFDRWNYPWSEPVRRRPEPLLVADQLAFALGRAPPYSETSYESKWHFAWSEPVRIKPGLLVDDQPFLGPLVIEPTFPNYLLTVRNQILRYVVVKGPAWVDPDDYPPEAESDI